ncbi:ATP-dependent Clp protease proteolytic subunit, partial [Treponema endosymbiont of Eucomonympha sp.]|uniref:ATP-dependent Clp protease proteolytic subunit n=1 Tax=Treponema endosymbiont of Eucomonympha sp. TaxID=1580831 RepID=UPI0016502670
DGTKSERYALPASRERIHQPWGGEQGQAADIAIQAKEIIRLKKITIDYFASQTGKTPETVAKDMERDFYMSSAEALEYGIVDHIMMRKGKNEKDGGCFSVCAACGARLCPRQLFAAYG